MIRRLLRLTVSQGLRRLEAQLAQRRTRKRHAAVFSYALIAKPLVTPLPGYCRHLPLLFCQLAPA